MRTSETINILLRKCVALLCALLLVGSPCVTIEAMAEPQTRPQNKTAKKKGSLGKSSGNSTGKKSGKGTGKSTGKSTGKGTGKNAGKGSGKSSRGGKKQSAASQGKSDRPLSADELRRRQEDARREVTRTKEELRRTEAEIKQGLSELSRLETGIQASRKETEALGKEVKKLSGRIGSLRTNIATHSAELDKLRAEYLKAVKKMRVTRKNNSTVAYLFGAKDLAQAERRMRYLKEFSEWKDARTRDIDSKVAVLKKENDALQRAKSDKDVMLGRELKAQQKLTSQKKEQDAVVAKLRGNQSALQDHLARKQSEVNRLGNQVAALIAEEQRKAEAARRAEEARLAEQRRAEEEARQAEEARREAERKAEAERREARELAKAEKEAERQAAARLAAQEEAARKAEEEARRAKERKDKEAARAAAKKAERERRKAEQARKEKEKAEQIRKEAEQREAREREEARKKAEKSKGKGKKTVKGKKNVEKSAAPKGGVAGKDYASARQRRPRSEGAVSAASSASAAAAASADFASMRGSLPRPVSGAFRVTSPFGRHALPDLPDVIYDNPGIDAEVSPGAMAQAVFGGTVSGVYMIPGFSTVVIVNHGEYYTVYGNLAGSAVKVGDRVKQGQTLGKITSDPDNPGHSEIHFEVWKGKQKMNPQSWIR